MKPFQYGFRIVGSCQNERRLVNADAAMKAHAECDPRAELQNECYLSAFCFGEDFAKLLRETGSTKGYVGECWSEWLWIDIDRDDFDLATTDTRRLVASLTDRYAVDELLLFYSGSKGFHVGLTLSLCGSPSPSMGFHLHCRRFAENVASIAGVTIDSGVYDRVRAFRAPNSRHPRTGRHKRFLTVDELMSLKPARLIELASEPEPFELPTMPPQNSQALCDWQAASKVVESEQTTSQKSHRSTLNRATMDFIRDGAMNGDRHRLLFSAAANLAEHGCKFELAWALLAESALDSGLAPSEVRRQIECGLNHKGSA